MSKFKVGMILKVDPQLFPDSNTYQRMGGLKLIKQYPDNSFDCQYERESRVYTKQMLNPDFWVIIKSSKQRKFI